MYERKDGEYYYAPHRRNWGVWKHIVSSESSSYGVFHRDFNTKEEARAEVYRLNGWKLKQ